MAYSLGKRSKKVYNSGLDQELLFIIDRALVACPIDFTLVSGKRTAPNQFLLYQIGRKPVDAKFKNNADDWHETGGGVVTYMDGYKRRSKHQKGWAFDFRAYIPGRPDLNYDRIHMAVIIGSFLTIANDLYESGAIKHKLRSGADWDRDTQFLEEGTFIDMPHLELYTP